MNLIKLQSEQNIHVKNALEALKNLSEKLKSLPHIETKDFVVYPDKVSYLDILTHTYKLYDFEKFNMILSEVHYSTKTYPIIKTNSLYICFKHCFNYVFSCNDFNYYKNIYETEQIISWFIKCLRLSREGSKFDVIKIIDKFPFPFKKTASGETINFVSEVIKLMETKKFISISRYDKMSFLNFKDSEIDKLLYFSFENLSFGGDKNKKTILTFPVLDYELFSRCGSNDLLLQDYIFNYVIAQSTNYITYDEYSNNIYLEYTPKDFIY